METGERGLAKTVQPITELFENIYIVGGTVRDTLIGVEPKDFDFASPNEAGEVERRLNNAGFEAWRINKSPQVVGTKFLGRNVEIAEFRGDTIEKDLGHRDFTMNSIAVTKNGDIIDPYDGLRDICKKIIRGRFPRDRFAEDPLRMLRALRFVSTLCFRVDEETKSAITEYAQSILMTAKERRFVELTKLLVGNNVKPALEMLFQTRLLGYLLPELYPITMFPRVMNKNKNTKDLWHHTKVVVQKSVPKPEIRWAALLHDMAKPQTMTEGDKVHFFQHDYLGAEMADGLLRKLKTGTTFRESVRGLISLHQRVGDVVSRRNDPPVSMNALRRLARDCDERKCDLGDLIELFAADCSSGRKETVERQRAHADLLREALKEIREEDLRPKLPKGIGKELMEHFRLEPGPEVGVKRKRLEELLVSGVVSSDMTPSQMFDILEEYK